MPIAWLVCTHAPTLYVANNLPLFWRLILHIDYRRQKEQTDAVEFYRNSALTEDQRCIVDLLVGKLKQSL